MEKNLLVLQKKKNDAFNDYDNAISSGKGAYLLEKAKKEGVYKINVGNLPPGKEAILRMKYVTELETEGESIKFSIPCTRTRLVNSSLLKKEEK